MITENIHHLYWTRREFLSYRLSAEIRNHEQSQIVLPLEIHNDLHANVQAIHVPSASMARLVLEHINTCPNQYNALDTTRSLIDEFTEQPIGEHLALQMPFLLLGTQALKRRSIS